MKHNKIKYDKIKSIVLKLDKANKKKVRNLTERLKIRDLLIHIPRIIKKTLK